jgi:hypothetical protein
MQAIEILGGLSNKRMDALKKGWAKKDCKEMGATGPLPPQPAQP